MRKVDASACSVITDDGIRWTSAKLIEIANSAILELSRMIATYSNNPVVRQLYPTTGLLSLTTLSISTGTGTLPASTIFLAEVVDASDNVYAYIPPEKYLYYRDAGKQPLTEGFFYTILYDVGGASKQLRVLPATSFTATLSYISAKFDYANTDGALTVYPTNVDDILLDVAEREARDREHNWERSKILDIRIATKLGINIGGQ